MSISKQFLGVGVACALAISTVVPASATPVLTNTAAVGSAAPDQLTEVRWRAGPAIIAGAIGGLALGAAIASQPRYYGPSYYYAPGYYYGYGPPAYEPYYYYYPDSRTHYYNGRVDTNGAQYNY